jgi:hypothetical protein
MALKHVGRVKNNRQKVVVAYRTIPGDPYSCLVVPTVDLPADEHDTLMKAVESAAGQQAGEFFEVMQRSMLPDGRNMLIGFHQRGNLRKFATSDIEMVPNINSSVPLDELNKMIAEQQGIALEDLAVGGGKSSPAPAPVIDPATDYVTETPAPSQPEVMDDAALAASYRSQADALFKEAKALREQAEALVPTKKKTTKKTETVET